jgi:hypothetical protein
MMPAILAYLDSPTYRRVQGSYSVADYQAGRVRSLCDATLVEVRPDGGQWRAGMDVACGDYDRRGGTMYQEDGGDMGHVVMVLSGAARYQVLSVAQEPGITPDPAMDRPALFRPRRCRDQQRPGADGANAGQPGAAGLGLRARS